MNEENIYNCWLRKGNYSNLAGLNQYIDFCNTIVVKEDKLVIATSVNELKLGIKRITGIEATVSKEATLKPQIVLEILQNIDGNEIGAEGFVIKKVNNNLTIIAKEDKGILYGVFHLLRCMSTGKSFKEAEIAETPVNAIRMIDQWDNISGDIERGYAGKSIFYKDDIVIKDIDRIKDYARLLASIGINSIAINNVNAHEIETKFITKDYLPDIANFAEVFRAYGIKLYLSINFAAPVEIGGLKVADPLAEEVKNWWKKTAENIYKFIPDFGGFLVKADSENRPGPFTYGRNHAEGANMLAEVLKPFDGLVIWRCFVYNCQLDWRDRSKDRAKAAYDNFKPLDGDFSDNVILQVKNGPMDFQIREAVSPLLGAMEKTNQLVEFQITQEYTGQQKHLCFLVPLWKEVLDFDTLAKGKGSFVSKVGSGTLFGRKHGGLVAVSNIGDSNCWTGHPLAQANLYGFGRLAWNPELSSKDIAEEWVKLTFGRDTKIVNNIVKMLLESREAYEKYTSPLGIGWMVNPNHHYGPSIDGYEYSAWGTYHYADFKGIGVDRTKATGTGYTNQYSKEISDLYEHIETCPEELLLYFHHVPYIYKLKSGKTLLQYIYDTHFEGVEKVEEFSEMWLELRALIDEETFDLVSDKLNIQMKDSKEWRDVVNTYFYRRTGIEDIHLRKIYK